MSNTKQEKEAQSEEIQKLEEQNQVLQRQLTVFQDLQNLGHEPYFRQQILMYLERMSAALEMPLEEPEEESKWEWKHKQKKNFWTT